MKTRTLGLATSGIVSVLLGGCYSSDVLGPEEIVEIHIYPTIEYIRNRLEEPENCYAVTDEKEIREFLEVLRLRKSDVHIPSSGRALFVFRKKNGSCLYAYLPLAPGILELSTSDGERMGQFEVNTAGLDALHEYLEEAELHLREQENKD